MGSPPNETTYGGGLKPTVTNRFTGSLGIREGTGSAPRQSTTVAKVFAVVLVSVLTILLSSDARISMVRVGLKIEGTMIDRCANASTTIVKTAIDKAVHPFPSRCASNTWLRRRKPALR